MQPLYNKDDKTLEEITKIFTDNGIEYFIKKKKGCIVKVHFIVKDDHYDIITAPEE